MLKKFVPEIFKRQKEVLPIAIADLDAIRASTRSAIIRVVDRVSHDLKNQLFAIYIVEHLEADRIRAELAPNRPQD